MKCPYCGNEMRPGCIQSRDCLYWTEKTRVLPALPPMDQNALHLTGGVKAFNGVTVEAHWCEACKKIVIDCKNLY